MDEQPHAMDFTGRAVLVTGGTRGPGATIARAFLASGADVMVRGRSTPAALPSTGGREAGFRVADLRDPVKVVALNLLAPFHTAQAANLAMREQQDGGSVINIGSVSAHTPQPGTAAYSAAKAGPCGAGLPLAVMRPLLVRQRRRPRRTRRRRDPGQVHDHPPPHIPLIVTLTLIRPTLYRLHDEIKGVLIMADITRRFGWRHLRSAPTAHIRHHKRGNLAHDGQGLSFWYRSLSAALSEVPVDDRELAMAFHARTADFQDVTVQATVTYRISDPAEAANRLDFSVDPDTGSWRGAPLEQIATLLTETAQQHTLDVLARTPLAAALVDGVASVRERVATGLAAEPRLPATGIDVVAVRVVAIRPEAEVERALRTPAREQIQQEADRATYERRAVAVERERAIAENELASQIELARREEQLVDQRGTNARREAEEKAAADGVRTEAEAARKVRLARAEAEAARETGGARAEAQAAWLRVHGEVDPATLHALAATRLAENLPRIESLTLSPDVLTGLLAKLGRPEGGASA